MFANVTPLSSPQSKSYLHYRLLMRGLLLMFQKSSVFTRKHTTCRGGHYNTAASNCLIQTIWGSKEETLESSSYFILVTSKFRFLYCECSKLCLVPLVVSRSLTVLWVCIQFPCVLTQHCTDFVLCLYVEPFLVGSEYKILGYNAAFSLLYFVF